MMDWLTNLFASFYHWVSGGLLVFYSWIDSNMTLATTLAFFLPLAVWMLCQLLRRLRSYVTLRNVLFVSVTVTAFLFCLSYYKSQFTPEGGSANWVSAVLMSFQHALRLFALDGDFGDVIMHLQTAHADASQYYAAFGAFLCFLAPLLTFTLLLSFLKNFSAKVYYTVHFLRATHVFSELNEKSLAMAKSLAKHHKVQFNDSVYNGWIFLTRPLRRKKKRAAQVKATFGKGRINATVPPLPEKPRRDSRAYLILSILAAPFRFLTRPLIVFTDVLDKHEEEHYELISEARKINALLFRKDLGSIHFRFRFSVWRHLSFYLISEDEPEKIRHATHIISRFDYRNAKLYVFSDNVECQLLLSPVETKHLTVKRINDIQALVYHNIDRHGLRLFRHAQAAHFKKYGRKSKERPTITVVVVGLGQYGMEMLRALFWYCQSIGSQFRLDIHAFDERKDIASRLHALCPDLNEARTNKPEEGGNQYEEDFYPTIHGGIKVDSNEFSEEIQKIGDANLVFVGLGTDELNISTAIHIRSLYEKMERKPDIETVVYDSNISKKMSVKWIDPYEKIEGTVGSRIKKLLSRYWRKLLKKLPKKWRLGRNEKASLGKATEQTDAEGGIKNNKDQPYGIHMIGDLENFYSAATLLHSELDREGELCELRWTTAGLLNRFEERDVLNKVIDYIKNPTYPFDPKTTLLFFPKTQSTETHLNIKPVDIAQVYEDRPIDNVTDTSKKHLHVCLIKRIREILEVPKDQELPSDALQRFQKKRDLAKIIYIREDPVSEDAIYEEVHPASDAASLLPDPSDNTLLQRLAARWNELCGKEDPRLAKLKKEEAENLAQKLYCVERDIKKFSKEIRSGKSPGFRTVEYNYRSSITRAMRDNLRKKVLPANSITKVFLTPCDPWTESEICVLEEVFKKDPQSRDLDEMRIIGKLEHPSWNAYMRSEGFTYGKETNMLAKRHKCLIATSALSAKELRKDA